MFSRIFKSSKGEGECVCVCMCVISETVAAENIDQAFEFKTSMLWDSEFGFIVGFFPFLSA